VSAVAIAIQRHSPMCDYAEPAAEPFQLMCCNFMLRWAESLIGRVLEMIRDPPAALSSGVCRGRRTHRPACETPEEVRDRVLEAARDIPLPSWHD